MTIDKNDPKITAYVLGELNKEECKTIEDEMKKNLKLAEEIREIKATSLLLKTELQKDAFPVLTENQRNKILKISGNVKEKLFHIRWAPWAFAMGSSMAIAFILLFTFMQSPKIKQKIYEQISSIVDNKNAHVSIKKEVKSHTVTANKMEAKSKIVYNHTIHSKSKKLQVSKNTKKLEPSTMDSASTTLESTSASSNQPVKSHKKFGIGYGGVLKGAHSKPSNTSQSYINQTTPSSVSYSHEATIDKKSTKMMFYNNDTILMGTLTKDQIWTTIKKYFSEIYECYDVVIGANQRLIDQVVFFKGLIIIEPSGRVQSVKITSTLNNVYAESCMASRIKFWVFPKFKEGDLAKIEFPFVFKPLNN